MLVVIHIHEGLNAAVPAVFRLRILSKQLDTGHSSYNRDDSDNTSPTTGIISYCYLPRREKQSTMAKVYLEVPVFSQLSAEFIIQAEHGTARLELNAEGSYGQGGTTPDPDTYRHAVINNPTPLRIMIRPRGPPHDGSPDFVYSSAEFDGMEEAMRLWQESGLMDEERGDGFVFGALKTKEEEEEGGTGGKGMRVDVDKNRRLVNVAAPYLCVFHRAFVSICSTALASLADSMGFRGCFARLERGLMSPLNKDHGPYEPGKLHDSSAVLDQSSSPTVFSRKHTYPTQAQSKHVIQKADFRGDRMTFSAAPAHL